MTSADGYDFRLANVRMEVDVTSGGILMTIASPTIESRTQQLRNLIQDLVDIVDAHGGRMTLRDAVPSVASRTGLPLSEVPYIVNSAVADRRITSDLRSGVLELVR